MIRSLVGGIYYGNYLASIIPTVVVDSLLISCSMLKRKVVDYTDMVLFSLSLSLSFSLSLSHFHTACLCLWYSEGFQG